MLAVLLSACNSLENSNYPLMLDLAPVITHVQEGAVAADITAMTRDGITVGYVVSFADGSGYTLLGQSEGGSAVSGLSEDSCFYYFEIEGGERVIVPKAYADPFKVELSGDEVVISDGGTVTAGYKVTGADDGIEVTVLAGEGWNAKVSASSDSEGTITVTAPDPITTDKVLVSVKDGSGRQVVKALRLTSKSSVRRGHIDTYVFCALGMGEVDPDIVGEETAVHRFKLAADAGIDIMQFVGNDYWLAEEWSEDALRALDMAEKAGIKLSVYIEYLMNDDAKLLKFVNAVKDHPALWGYQLHDEPNTDAYASIAHTREVIKTVDKKHPCYVNLHGYGCVVGPSGSYKAASFEEYIQRYADETDPEFISFDVYPCYVDMVLDENFYSSLEIVSRISKASNVDFWAFTATCRFHDGYGWHSKPSMETLRLQNYTNLVYGAQGLEYFTWVAVADDGTSFCDWPIDIYGEINQACPTYGYMQAINEEVQNRAFVFDGCELKWAGHHNDIPIECTAVDKSMIPEEIVSYSSDADLLMTLIENDGGRSEYLNIMSRTHLKPGRVQVRFGRPVQTVERDGSLKSLNAGDYEFNIEPGDIVIIKTR